ncbi:MAG: hypothetical protein HRT72_06880 [Flavobacteriales bacterium]|nr:hypothetical protein [Flavobacteriales bacterium]
MAEKFIHDTLVITQKLNCYLDCWHVSHADFQESFADVDVDFSASSVRDTRVKVYHSTIVLNGEERVMEIISRRTDFELKSVLNSKGACGCD